MFKNLVMKPSFFLVVSLLFSSCGEESLDKHKNSYVYYTQSSKECQQSDFSKNFLGPDNFEVIAKCLSWDKEYPTLIQEITNEKYLEQKTFKSLNQSLFKTKKNKATLVELGKNVPAVYDFSAQFLEAVFNNPELSLTFQTFIANNEFNIKKSDIKSFANNLFQFLEFLESGRSTLFTSFIGDEKWISEKINFGLADNSFEKVLSKIGGIAPGQGNDILNILAYKMKDNDRDQIIKSLNNLEMDYESFSSLIIKREVNCGIAGSQYLFNIDEELKKIFEVYQTLNADKIFHETTELMARLNWFTTLCDSKDTETILGLLKNSSSILVEPKVQALIALYAISFKDFEQFKSFIINGVLKEDLRYFSSLVKKGALDGLGGVLRDKQITNLIDAAQNALEILPHFKKFIKETDRVNQLHFLSVISKLLSFEGSLANSWHQYHKLFMEASVYSELQQLSKENLIESFKVLDDLSNNIELRKLLKSKMPSKLLFYYFKKNRFEEQSTAEAQENLENILLLPRYKKIKKCSETLYQNLFNTRPYAFSEIGEKCEGEGGFVNSLKWVYEANKIFAKNGDDLINGIGIWNKEFFALLLDTKLALNESGQKENEVLSSDIFNLLQSQSANNFWRLIGVNTDLVYDGLVVLNETKQTTTANFLKSIAVTNPNYPIKNCEEFFEARVTKCFSSEFIKSESERFIDEMFVENERGEDQLLQLFKFLDPKQGMVLSTGEKYSLSVKDLLSFFYTFSRSRDKVVYNNGSNKITGEISKLKQLEIIIREINFLNNFYGAYFVNELSDTKNYKKTIKLFKQELKLMYATADFFIRRKIYPPDAKIRLRNISETFDSLIYFTKKESDILSNQNLTRLAQGVLTMLKSSSPLKAQSFKALQRPDPKIVDGHGARNLFTLMNLSFLSNFSSVLENYVSIKDYEYINELDKNLFKDIDFKLFHKKLKSFYLEDRETFIKAIHNIINQYFNLNNSQRSIFWEAIKNIMIVKSAYEIKMDRHLEKIADYLRLFAGDEFNLAAFASGLDEILVSFLEADQNGQVINKINLNPELVLNGIRLLSNKDLYTAFKELNGNYSNLIISSDSYKNTMAKTIHALSKNILESNDPKHLIERFTQSFADQDGWVKHILFVHGFSPELCQEILEQVELSKSE
jgi:hypothetical protein